EILVHGRKTDVGDVVERLQPLHHQVADVMRLDVRFAGAFELTHDAADHALDALRLDGALAHGDLDRAHQLLPVEGHAPSVAFDHRQLAQLHPLEGREATAARGADPPAANRGVVLRRAGVLHLSVVAGAIGTPHGSYAP